MWAHCFCKVPHFLTTIIPYPNLLPSQVLALFKHTFCRENSDHRAHPSSSGGNYQGRRDDRDKRERPPSSGGRSDQGNRDRRPFGNGRSNPNLNPNPNYGNNSNSYNNGGRDNRPSRPPAPDPRAASMTELRQPSYHKSYHPLYNGRALTWQEFYNLTNDGTKMACVACGV